MSSIENDVLFPASREGIYGSPLPDRAEPFVSGVQDQEMLDGTAAAHREWLESVGLPDGTIPEAVYPDDTELRGRAEGGNGVRAISTITLLSAKEGIAYAAGIPENRSLLELFRRESAEIDAELQRRGIDATSERLGEDLREKLDDEEFEF